MPPKRTRNDADDAPELAQPTKKVKDNTGKAKPASKKNAPKTASTTRKAPTKTAAKTQAEKAPPKKAASAKAPSARAASVSAPSAPKANGTTVKPAAKAAKVTKATKPKEPVVQKKVDPMDLIYADPKPALRKLAVKKTINEPAPTNALDIFVCGEGSNAELGLGTARNQMDVKRPRFNAAISSKGIVRLATGGMHVLALSKDGEVYSWGVNDQGALGRDTRWDGGLKDVDMDSDDSDDEGSDSGLNPHEANPAAIDPKFFHPGSVIVDVAAGDSCSFALTAEGRVYGWGTFRSNEGILGFSKETVVQRTPYLLKSLKNITKIAVGDNHALALDDKGVVWAWGSGQQSQLGRRIIERTKREGLNPAPAVIKHNENDRRSIKVADIACGAYNSFAIDKEGNIWSWGANNYGECGHFSNAGEDGAIVLWPTLVEDLEKDGKARQISQIHGGAHHTVAVTKDGECLVWGRCDGGQTGIALSELNKEHVITNTGMTAAEVESKEGQVATRSYKILAYPTAIPAIGSTAVYACCGSDHTIVVTDKGKAWTSGFSANYQTGQGTDEDIDVSTMIDNTATRNRKLIWAGAGGQFSVFAAEQEGSNGDVKMNGA